MKVNKLITLILLSMSIVMISYEMKQFIVYVFLNMVFLFVIGNTFFDLIKD